MTDKKTDSTPTATEEAPLTLEQATAHIKSLETQLTNLEAFVLETLRPAQQQHAGYIDQLLNYVEEIDAVTFISLYLQTGGIKLKDVTKISQRRIEQANALRINGRRALGEFREKQRIVELKEKATELGVEFDDDTLYPVIEARVAEAEHAKAIEAEKSKEDVSTDSNKS